MKFENYTTEVFLENYFRDCETFGEETTQAIYEEIFSTISNKKVKLDGFVKALNEEVDLEALQVVLEAPLPLPPGVEAAAGPTTWLKPSSLIPKNGVGYDAALALEKAAETAGVDKLARIAKWKAFKDNTKGFFSNIGNFLSGLPAKVKSFFGGLKGKSFGEIMKQGLTWVKDNPMIALKTTGGIALVIMLIKALRKKGQLDRYENLRALAARTGQLKEDAYDTILEDSKEKKALREVLEECKTNKALSKLFEGGF